MLLSPIPEHETARLEALAEYEPAEPFENAAYAPVLELARDMFEVPTAFVSLVGYEAQNFPVKLGLEPDSTRRDISFCGHAVASGEMLVVLDTVLDPRFADNPLVLGPPFIRFYAGAPLISPSNHTVGTLCVVDTAPRDSFGPAQRKNLALMAALVLDTLEARRLDIARRSGQGRFEAIASSSPDAIICAGGHGAITFWNAAAERMFGYSTAEAVGQSIDLIAPERMRDGHASGLHWAGNGAPLPAGSTADLVARRRDGSEFPIELSLSVWQEDDDRGFGGASFGAILRDLTQRRATEDRLVHSANHDALTELPNRTFVRHRIEQLAGAGERATLLLVDLDGFKAVNDDLGHAAGDHVLCVVAQRLLACVRNSDIVARHGGDEFALLLPNVVDHLRASHIANGVIQSLSGPISLADRVVTIGASVGVAMFPHDGATMETLLGSADLALYQAKSEGRRCYRTFTTDLREASERGRAYGGELRRAYENGEFEVFYQPQICLATGALTGAEALLRWRHPADGLLAPAAFISTLEHLPVSAQVGQQVMRTACRQAVVWRACGAPNFQIAVNLFGSQFTSGTLAQDVTQVLAETGLPPGGLELELTENILLRYDETMLGPLQQLRALGVNIAFDDFGTGFASLSMLKRFPITRLKVDQSFVRGMCESSEDAAIVRCIIYLGQAFGFGITAEGVETEDQAAQLASEGCEEVQGYLYGRPLPAPEFASQFGLCSPTNVPLPPPRKVHKRTGEAQLMQQRREQVAALSDTGF